MSELMEVRIPDIGDVDQVDVVEILVAVGDSVVAEDSLITLESDKASMDVPSPAAGTVKELKVKSGDQVKEGDLVLLLETAESAKPAESAESAKPAESAEPAKAEKAAKESSKEAPADEKPADQEPADQEPADQEPAETPADKTAAEARPIDEQAFANAYASPSVRKLARELGADLGAISGTGRKNRITEDDVKQWIKKALAEHASGSSAAGAGGQGGSGGIQGFEWPQMPTIDFAKFGEIEVKPMSRIQRVSKRNLHRSWLHVPHVTQHDDADVTELEEFRQQHKEEAKKKGINLTPVAFLLKATASALRSFPTFNSSLHEDGDKLIVKKYIHIGVAVDTPDGLVVPVIRDVDQKGLYQLAQEVVETSVKARDGKLSPADFQGASFTISSLGGIGGTAFTPIVNAPEVAILGASRNQWKPVWNGTDFEPRLMLPLSLSYDHRVIDGAAACRFVVHLAGLLSDLKRLLL